MRPGEKLYEEVSTLLEDTAPTAHEKIRVYAGNQPVQDPVVPRNSVRHENRLRIDPA
jgi:FlaA1/EpsC-like NDP-sugar epimerase